MLQVQAAPPPAHNSVALGAHRVAPIPAERGEWQCKQHEQSWLCHGGATASIVSNRAASGSRLGHRFAEAATPYTGSVNHLSATSQGCTLTTLLTDILTVFLVFLFKPICKNRTVRLTSTLGSLQSTVICWPATCRHHPKGLVHQELGLSSHLPSSLEIQTGDWNCHRTAS